MTIKRFNLQFFSEEAFVEEEVTTEEDVDTSEDTPIEAEETEESEEPDFTEADKSFLDRFEIQFDKNAKKFDSIEALKEAAEMGSALPRYKEKVSEFEKKLESPHYKWVDDYMKANGYQDPANFVKAIKINEEKTSLMEAGMSEEAAQAKAEEYVNKTFGNKTDKKSQEIDNFLQWHQGKVDGGKFKESLDIDSIPQQVIEAYENGGSLKEAYMDYMLDDITVKTEQETLKKITKNKETSTGELKPSTGKETKLTPEQIETKLESMSSKDKTKWINANMELIEKSGYFN